MGEQEGRDDLEGRYTQSDPEVPEPRGVHGQYTERESEGPQPDVLGTYIGTEREGTEPLVRSTHQRIGNYPASERDSASQQGSDSAKHQREHRHHKQK